MSGKSKWSKEMTWETSTPVPWVPNLPEPPVGTATGAMASTNTVYTNIYETDLYDNVGIEVTWSGTPTGTIQVMCSNSGTTFYALTFDPVLGQPAGSAGGYLIDLNQLPFKYVMLQYTNSTGSGTISAYICSKDLN